MSERLEQMAAARRRAEMVARLRGLAKNGAGGGAGARAAAGGGLGAGPAGAARAAGPVAPARERCDLCRTTLPDGHRHMLHLEERRIVCTCEACWALHSGDPEYRPVGMRTIWLDDFVFSDELWASFQIPIGLAFFMRSTVTGGVVAFYPSPAGATESELDLETWDALVEANPRLDLEPDAEGLIVNRMSEPAQYVIAAIDDCYALVGLIKSKWEGISGGTALERALPEFFAGLRAKGAGYPAAAR
jgi:hypothetical protein